MLSIKQEAWLQALESGKFEQGHRDLRTANRFCCLGVICELEGLERIQEGFRDGPDLLFRGLNNRLIELYGLHSGFGSSLYRDQSLSKLNDDGATHMEIATLIRYNPRKWLKC